MILKTKQKPIQLFRIGFYYTSIKLAAVDKTIITSITIANIFATFSFISYTSY